MSEESAFRLLGPIMVGPSSSHTAGAVRIGRMAREIHGKPPKEVTIYLHGSFAETWKGHGSDKALIGGLLGFHTYDKRIKEADVYAEEAKMNVTFKRIDLGTKYHPNSIKIVIEDGDEEEPTEIIGESVGGGDIVIRLIMGFPSEITGDLNTIVLCHRDYLGTLSQITQTVVEFNLNIVALRSKDLPRLEKALTTLEIEQKIPPEIREKLLEIKGMQLVRILPKISEGEEMF
ncbi:MAG: L-serine ammonia-lyase, iron-sulfur-dependent, subunit beta [Candidatus Heimdallarchaeota archaeon]|nr:L-serine ammonia-lyase, iron-sulfur-dependent, subunit beta [Candidatus Heimdallarchaeota archaeon]